MKSSTEMKVPHDGDSAPSGGSSFQSLCGGRRGCVSGVSAAAASLVLQAAVVSAVKEEAGFGGFSFLWFHVSCV